MKKSIHNLMPDDFHHNLVWQPVDDFEDPDMEVMPYEEEILDMDEMYLIASKFTFADGSEWEGYIRFSWGTPVEMALAINNREFRPFALERDVETEEGHRRFARNFNKNYSEVFPIEYQIKAKIFLRSAVH